MCRFSRTLLCLIATLCVVGCGNHNHGTGEATGGATQVSPTPHPTPKHERATASPVKRTGQNVIARERATDAPQSVPTAHGEVAAPRSVALARACGMCYGTGRRSCGMCYGVGSRTESRATTEYDYYSKQMRSRTVYEPRSCVYCAGAGRTLCGVCGGSGRVSY